MKKFEKHLRISKNSSIITFRSQKPSKAVSEVNHKLKEKRLSLSCFSNQEYWPISGSFDQKE